MENRSTPVPPPPVRDLELESELVGPTTRMILVETDDEGRVIYHCGRRRHHTITLTRSHARTRLLLLDSQRWSILLEPNQKRLVAIYFQVGTGGRTFLMGTDWGKWINERGALMTAFSVPELIMQWDLPVELYEARQALGIEFPVNTHNKEIFTPGALVAFRDRHMQYILELQFSYPLGGFRLARIKTRNDQNRSDVFMELTDFPLMTKETKTTTGQARPAGQDGGHREPGAQPQAPPQAGAQQTTAKQAQPHQVPPHGRPAAGPQAGAPHAAAQPRAFGKPGAGAGATMGGPRVMPGRIPPPEREAIGPPRQPRPELTATAKPEAPPPGTRPLPRTELLPINEMLTVISTERDLERRWKMIEANLVMNRPERTYPLIARYPELIGEQAGQWAPPRLKMVFGTQPGAVLIGVMANWAVNQVLAIAEGNSDPAKILEWLREREIDRLLKLDLTQEIYTEEAARKALKVDRFADEATIKKAWRTLLGFMNADHGRSEERAIHRKKDEIAKYLQVARNVLLKQH